MSEEKPEVAVKRRTFTPEFKADAVRLVTDEKYTFQAAAKALGVGEQSLRQAAPPPSAPAGKTPRPGRGPIRPPMQRVARTVTVKKLPRKPR